MEDITEVEFTPDGIVEKSPVRSEASKKAWDTRRAAAKAKAEAMKAPVTGGISIEDANLIRNLTQQICEQRELVGEVQDRLMATEQQLEAVLERVTVK